MGKFVLSNVKLFTGGTDMTGASNKLDWASEVESKTVTTWGSSDGTRVWEEYIGGLASTKIQAAGLWEAGPGLVDDELWADRGGVGPWTACPDTAAVGSLAYLTKAMGGSYQLGGTVGDVAPWTANASSTWPTARGQILHPPATARTANGSGTARQLGAVTAARSLYVCLHVLAVSGTGGPTLTVIVESDDASGFSSPITRATFTAATAIGGQAVAVAGPVTDDYWRVRWTVGGTTPSFQFVVAAGIA